jgi:hypothetical protein
MTINLNNFEAYMLDYLEGNLDPLLSAELMAFLAENPAFEKYLPEYDSRISFSGTHGYPLKNNLKKDFADIPEITPENFDEFCIAACEGLLGDRDMARISVYIAHYRERQNNLDLFRKLKLQPDFAVVYTRKSQLKKSIAQHQKLRYLYLTVGLAASMALLIMLAVRKQPATDYRVTLPVIKAGSENTLHPVSSDHPDRIIAAKKASAPVDNNPSRQASKNASLALVELLVPGREGTTLNSLEPITKTILISIPEPRTVEDPLIITHPGHPVLAKTEAGKQSDSFTDSFLGSLIAKVNFWKTAKTAIQGFNYLTEAQLSIDKTTDENGRLTRLQVGMENYAISGNKIK